MQAEARITGEGQVIIPPEIRRLLHLAEGDTVVFEADAEGVHLRSHAHPPANVFATYAGISREGQGMSVDEIVASLRAERGHDQP